METTSYDILVIGGGGAGLRAAIAIAETDPELSVAVVSKVYPMRSHTVSAEGGAAAVARAEDSLDAHAYDTVSGGDWLCDQDAVEVFVREAPEEMLRLERWGCPWSRTADGHVAVRPFGGMKNERTWFAADKTGFHMLHTLYQTSLKYAPLTFFDEWFVTDLLVEGGRCQGVVAIELATGKVGALLAKAVILTTGGCGRVFAFTTNANIKTGDGMALAYRAGVPLKDMEFVQYHPTGLPFTGILITEAARSEGGWMLNKDGYRYLQDYDLGKPEPKPVLRSMELGPRDRLSQAFVKEMEKGRTTTTAYGEVVHLDIRHLGEKLIDAKLPFVRELCRKYENLDPVREMIPVRPVVHYMMGGVHTDLEGATPLPGLYAAGEVACVSVHGANRLGTNSLVDLIVFGRRAGKHIAAKWLPEADFAPLPADPDAYATTLVESLLAHAQSGKNGKKGTEAGETQEAIRQELRDEMMEKVGVVRDEAGLLAMQRKIAELKARWEAVRLMDGSRTFNTELMEVIELGNLIECSEATVAGALARKESRGGHYRADYEKRDDANFLQHTLAYRSDRPGAPELRYKPVVITEFQPKERKY